MNIWTVVVNYNGLEDSRKCLQSLSEASGPDSPVVLVDNASAQDPQPILQPDYPSVHFLRNTVNGGWAGGNNAGIRYALEHGADAVLLLNNDTVVAPELLPRLRAAALAYPEYGVIGPVIRAMSPPHEVMTDGCLFNRPQERGFFQREAVPLASGPTPAMTQVDIVNGCCMLIRAAVVERIGLIDERFFLIHEESDFCLRAQAAGFRCGVIGDALVWHKGSTSFLRTGKRLQRYYDARNLYLLLRKHRATRGGRRGHLASLGEYLKYTYYRFSLELEAGQSDAATAVLEGVCDAFGGRFAAFAPRRRPALPLLRRFFQLVHTLRQPGTVNQEKGLHAASIR